MEAESGKILIDDVDISGIGLNELRHALTIIPQEPTLVEGSVKENVDMEGSFDEEEIIDVMKKVGLESFLGDKTLNYKIEDKGSNISVGERQLICIARAVLRKTKIIVMDEATASIDFKTESLIQSCISNLLKDSTVITIAHRIKTVLKYDKILVMDEGKLVEFDTPEELIKKKGFFYNLYNKSNI